jgi:hypothetical protein
MENSGNQEFLDMFLCHNLYTKSMPSFQLVQYGFPKVYQSIYSISQAEEEPRNYQVPLD